MRLLSSIRATLDFLFRRRRAEQEMEEELRSHLRIRADELERSGLSREEAERQARIEFGGYQRYKEECREALGTRLVGELLADLRYGLRQLRRNPGFTAVAVITLALGIGANTAIFSVVYGVLLRPLPYPHAERMVRIVRTDRGRQETGTGFTAQAFDFWKEHGKPFQFLAASASESVNLTGRGRAEHLEILRVSTRYFDVYGVKPFLGRNFSLQENLVGGPNVAILSYGLWKEHFAGDSHAIGRSILLNGAPYTVIGVMPDGFAGAAPVSLWSTISQVRDTVGGGQNYHVTGRLKPNVSRKQANVYLAGVAQAFANENYQWMPEADRKAISFVAEPILTPITNYARTPLLILLGAVGFVLLIACVNVANLLLSRTAARSREIAMRTALGAGCGRIFRQLLIESVLLALIGAAFGLLIAFWSLHSLLALAPDVLPRAQHIALNGWAMLFTAGIAVSTGILFGLAPAFEASRTNLNESLKEGAGRASFSLRRHRLSDGMVSVEVALSLILLIGAGLLIATFANLLRTNPGFDQHNMLALSIWTTGSKYKSTPALSVFYNKLIARLDAIPGVKSAAVVGAGLPLEWGGNGAVRTEAHPRLFSADYREVTPAYFRTLRDPVLAGRSFTQSDSPDSAKVAIINAAFAHRYFSRRNPIDSHLIFSGSRETALIIGVAGDVKSLLNEPAPPTFFIPMAQADFATDQLFQGWFPTYILVRTSVKPLALSHAVEAAVRDANPNIPIGQIQSMDQVLSVSIAFNRFLMVLMSVFGGLALVLAAIGIYGILSYSVSQRVHEIGIRMALGAQRGDVLRGVLMHGLRMTLVGVGAGIIAAPTLAGLIANQLYGVHATDPLTFIVVALVLIAIALIATYIPARRATKVDPMIALRYE